MAENQAATLLRQRFGEVHGVFDFGDNAQAWLADPGFVGARRPSEFVLALRARLYVAELSWAGGRWCVEVTAFEPRTGRATRDRHAGLTAFESRQRAQATLRAWALLLAGKFDGSDAVHPA